MTHSFLCLVIDISSWITITRSLNKSCCITDIGKIGVRVCAGADSNYSAIFGQVLNKAGVRLIAVDHKLEFHLTSRC